MTPLLQLVVAAALIATFNHSNPASKVVEPTNLTEWKVTSSDYGGKLLLSDSPEIVPSDGILYQDSINGEGRVFFHHVNGANVPKQFIILIENIGPSPVHVIVSRHGLGGPAMDYLAVGKTAQQGYMAGQDPYIMEIAPQKVVSLLASDIIVQPDMLVSGIYDVKTDQKVNVSILMKPVGSNSEQFLKQASVLPPDIYHLRGTFATNNRMINPTQIYNPADGTVAITLADNQIDKYLTGIDATDNSRVVNYGNYGVMYHINVPSKVNAKISYYLNPRGGVYSGAMGVKVQQSNLKPIDIPSGKVYFGENTLGDVALIGNYPSGTPLEFTFSPPGSSNLPVKLIITPQK